MPTTWTLPEAAEADVRRLAELIALKVRPGDTLALHGDLGAGKTTFARALVRAVLGEPEAEVPSPTFALVQTYDAPRLPLAHVDLYRLADEGEALELGIQDLAERGAVIVEWPERAPFLSGPDRLDITLTDVAAAAAELRHVAITAHGTWEARLQRLKDIANFLHRNGLRSEDRIAYLQGDASARAYARLLRGGEPMILMDWPPQPDGPPIRDGLPYSRIAHLAEGTAAFDAVAGLLASEGLVVPEIHAADHDRGLMLIGDLGERVFSAEVSRGAPLDTMWTAATDTLLALRTCDEAHVRAWNGGHGRAARIGDYDRGAYAIEITLLADWYWPLVKGGPMPDAVRAAFDAAWVPVLDRIVADPSRVIALRDFHSPNLFFMPERSGAASNQVGLIDFQDALIGHPAFDLVSLLQDARLDVPPGLEDRLYARYTRGVAEREKGFDGIRFRFAYSALGAQRNTKILGIFARLWKRDGKPQYLRHIPRIWRYLERDLAHAELGALAAWYGAHFPPDVRACAPPSS